MKVQGIGWLVVRVVDFDAMRDWYRDVLGLTLLRNVDGLMAMFDCGNGNLLEVSATGQSVATPVSDRTEQAITPVLRVYDFDDTIAQLQSNGVAFLDANHVIAGGRLAWFFDPEGHLLAIQERAEDSTRPEDQVLRAQWES